MFDLNRSQWAAQEEKRVKIEADNKREIYILQCQQEKERDESMALRKQRLHKLATMLIYKVVNRAYTNKIPVG